ncbi:hypothetical protein pb186bvf_007202 [Paramecium bursaria]
MKYITQFSEFIKNRCFSQMTVRNIMTIVLHRFNSHFEQNYYYKNHRFQDEQITIQFFALFVTACTQTNFQSPNFIGKIEYFHFILFYNLKTLYLNSQIHNNCFTLSNLFHRTPNSKVQFSQEKCTSFSQNYVIKQSYIGIPHKQFIISEFFFNQIVLQNFYTLLLQEKDIVVDLSLKEFILQMIEIFIIHKIQIFHGFLSYLINLRKNERMIS